MEIKYTLKIQVFCKQHFHKEHEAHMDNIKINPVVDIDKNILNQKSVTLRSDIYVLSKT